MQTKEGKKLVLLLANGWSLRSEKIGNIFHRDFNPFFNNLVYNHRFVPMIRDLSVKPKETLLAGENVYHNEELAKRHLKKFWQLPSIAKSIDSLARNHGRLWFLTLNKSDDLDKILESTNLPVPKIGLVNLGKGQKPIKNNRVDSIFFNSNTPPKRSLPVNPEDIVVYFCDRSEIPTFSPLLSRSKYKPLKFIVLSDFEETNQFETIVKKQQTSNLLNEIQASEISEEELVIDPQEFKINDLPKTEFTFLNLPADYFSIHHNWEELEKRRNTLVNLVLDILYLTNYEILLTSYQGNLVIPRHNLELLPTVILKKNSLRSHFPQKKIFERRSLLELFLKTENTLADLAPTILNYLDLEIPSTMTGTSFLPRLFPENYLGEHRHLSTRVPADSLGSMFS